MKKIITLLFCLSTNFLFANELPKLRAKNCHIEDEYGNRVVLRGVNLGNWLVIETFMLPLKTSSSKYAEIEDDKGFWNVLQMRFGNEKMKEIRTHFRKNWITEKDFARIKKLGFNCVRLPFLCDLLDEEDGFYWLDWALDCAKKHDLYVILDLHGAHGGQSPHEHTGQINVDQFFKNSDFWEQTAKLWKAIAERYKDRSELAGYDLLNEPMGAPDSELLYKVQDKLYRRIRGVDSAHLIFIEDGFKSIKFMPDPKKYGWKNVVMSSHIYSHDKLSVDELKNFFDNHLREIEKESSARKMPYFLGEFNARPHGSLENLKMFVKDLHKKDISYTFWSYKIVHNGHSMWGLYYGKKDIQKINLYSDSFKDLLKKISRLNTHNLSKNEDVQKIFSEK